MDSGGQLLIQEMMLSILKLLVTSWGTAIIT